MKTGYFVKDPKAGAERTDPSDLSGALGNQETAGE